MEMFIPNDVERGISPPRRALLENISNDRPFKRPAGQADVHIADVVFVLIVRLKSAIARIP